MPFMSPGDSAPVTFSPGDTAFVLNRGTAEPTARHWAALCCRQGWARRRTGLRNSTGDSGYLVVAFLTLLAAGAAAADGGGVVV